MAWTQLTNNGKTTLSAGCTDVATAITPTAKTTFPDPEDDGSFYATIWDADTYPDPGDDPGMEIVLVTADAAANWTVTRGQAGTAGAAHVAGDAVRLLWLAEHAQEIQDAVDLNSTHRTDVDAITGLVSGDGAGAYTGVARANLTGTANQVTLTGDGSNTLLGTAIQLGLPQSIGTTSTPQFARMGLGQAAAAGATLGLAETFTQQTGNGTVIALAGVLSPAGALSGNTRLRGLSATARWGSTENGATNGIIYGIEFEVGTEGTASGALLRADANRASVIHYGSGVMTTATGVYSLIRNDDAAAETGDITTAYNYFASAYTDKATGVIVTRYGLYVADVSGGGLCTTQYGIYVAALSGAGTNVAAYLGGDVQIAGGLDVASTTAAFSPPRMTTTQRDAIASPAAGMVIYNTTTNVLNFHNGSAWGAV